MVKLSIRIDTVFNTGMDILEELGHGNPRENYYMICHRLAKMFDWHYAEVWFYDNQSLQMILSDIHYAKTDELEQFSKVRANSRFSYGKGIPGEVWETKEPLWIDNVTTYQSFKRKEAAKTMKFKTCLALPVTAYDHVDAVILFFSKSSYEPDPTVLKLLHSIVQRVGINLVKHELEEDIRRLTLKSDQFSELISKISSIRDPYTSKHEYLVKNLALYIGNKMNMNREELDDLKLAALLHDIGKIAIPMELLSKPSKLNREEFALIKTHVAAGHSIVENLSISNRVKRVILEHHERLDGSGYPNNTKGNDIDICSQIIAIADVTSAMLENRPYRVAHKIETVKDELSHNRGTKYNSDVVDIVINLMDTQPEFFMNQA